ncbi:MAG: hypothetical protein KKA05_01500, partial [Alphaproteobacteria bacterium]|nr:hypothetical protein [Alphaproteobacteria bacterium]
MSGTKKQAARTGAVKDHPYDIRAILAQVLTPLRMELTGIIQSDPKTNPFTVLKFDSFCDRLGDALPDRTHFD